MYIKIFNYLIGIVYIGLMHKKSLDSKLYDYFDARDIDLGQRY